MEGKLKIRKVKKVGGSLTVVIPKNMGLEDGDDVSVDQVANSSTVLLTKVIKEGKLKTRKVKKVGGSLTIIIPKNIGLEDGDYVSVDQVANSSTVLLIKVIMEGH